MFLRADIAFGNKKAFAIGSRKVGLLFLNVNISVAKGLFFVLFSIVSTASISAEFDVYPSKVSSKEQVTLRWKGDGNGAFISGVGEVSDSGELIIQPADTVKYWLIVRDGERVKAINRTVEVEGGRGVGDIVINFSDFPPARHKSYGGVRYESFLDAVERVLDEQWAMVPTWMRAPADKHFTAVTQSVSHSELIGPGEKGIWDRKVAFLVRIQDPASGADAGVINFELSASIESRRRSEKIYSKEAAGGTVSRAATDKFLADLRRQLSNQNDSSSK